jgi:hypothetical protein
LKISLAEDPVETYLSSRKARPDAGPEPTDWWWILKWVGLLFVVLQLFWWLMPAISRIHLD